MSNNIAWCVNPGGGNGESWNPVVGCSAISPGCAHCWAAAFASRGLSARHAGLAEHGRWIAGPRFIPEALSEPLRRRTPTGYAVCLMGDLFHDGVTDGQIARVWMTMAHCQQHRFYVLTKRAARMESWLSRWADTSGDNAVEPVAGRVTRGRGPDATRSAYTSGRAHLFAAALETMGEPPPGCCFPTYDWAEGPRWWPTVLPNVWLGVTVENQAAAEERVPHLLRCPARVRFLSLEPLLEDVRLDSWWLGKKRKESCGGCVEGHDTYADCRGHEVGGIGWVIVGGESGPKARPFDLAWARSIRDQCKAAGVPVFVKQMGANAVQSCGPECEHYLALHDRAGADPAEWPADLRVREMPEAR